MIIEELKSYEEYKRYIGENEMTFLFIYAEWCKPCVEFKPTLLKYLEERVYPDHIGIGFINYDEMKRDSEWFLIFEKTHLPSFYSHHLGNYDKPIISVDLIFIHPFIENKLNEMCEKRKLKITDDF